MKLSQWHSDRFMIEYGHSFSLPYGPSKSSFTGSIIEENVYAQKKSLL